MSCPQLWALPSGVPVLRGWDTLLAPRTDSEGSRQAGLLVTRLLVNPGGHWEARGRDPESGDHSLSHEQP